ncbi:MAG TPA: carbohydrate kinase family protein [Acidiferrobacterales bacterium]|nr:carbohydrate kinase family protein [Acidiferrobacterales bacterium]
MATRFDVVVIGNVGIDTNVYFHGADVDFTREANFTENLDYVGQAGGYASRGYARLGKRTAFIGYVGDDYSGRFIREEFARDGIDTTGLLVDPAGTSRSINFMYRDGRRKNFYDGKSHMTLQPDRAISHRLLSEAKLAHFNIPNWARRLLPIAKELGLAIACDIQDVLTLRDGYREDFIDYADIVFFSAVNQANPAPLIEELLAWKPDLIVVSGMGAQGCALGTQEGVRYFEPVTLDAPVIDTNGAGDGLAVGFLASYVLDGHSLEDSIRRGQIAARYTCTQKASSSSLITPEQLAAYYKRV